MAWAFGDGFDAYTTIADILGYWELGVTTGTALLPGRFAGSQAFQTSNTTSNVPLAKTSNVNDAVHHMCFAFRNLAALGASAPLDFIQLLDGTVGQCAIGFNQNGSIVLTSGTVLGTTLATYANAFPTGGWNHFEIEVVINNTTGSFTVRKNGNTTADFTATGLNTRGGTANNYANKIQIGTQNSVNNHTFDDFFWRSDATSIAWMGDLRCYTRMPASDVSAQFARTPNPATITVSISTTNSDVTAVSRYTPFTPNFTGTVGSIVVQLSGAIVGNMKCSMFSDNASNPANILGSATTLNNPTTGANTFTFGTPIAVTKGVVYWFGLSHDVTTVFQVAGGNTGKSTSSVAYAAFPTASPGTLGIAPAISSTVNITPTVNAEYVSETLQDGLATYVYDSTVGHADFYNIAPLASTPTSVIALTTRGFMQKSDSGTRTGTVQLKSSINPVLTTWNPADKEANITLSGSNLTATAVTTASVRGTISQSTGKFYWEITATIFTSAPSFLGLATAAAVLANAYSQSGVVGVTRSGLVYVDNTPIGSLSAITSGTIVCFAMDFTNKLIWIRFGAAGQWNGSGTANPATGTGGFASGTIGAGTAAYPYFYGNGAGEAVTANFGASAFAGTVPAGFAAGFTVPPSSTTVAAPTLNLNTNFAWAWRTDTVDPNTSSAWTAANANAVQIGPLVVS